MKVCTKCKVERSRSEFSPHAKAADGLQSWCRPCRGVANRAAYERKRHHLKRYGLSPADYDRMAAAQGGVCAICERPCSTGQRLAVDHDHRTGLVRGLLCMNCNRALGHLRDDVRLLKRARGYLEDHNYFAQQGAMNMGYL